MIVLQKVRCRLIMLRMDEVNGEEDDDDQLAPSKCTWTLHKSHFVREFTSEMPQASGFTLIKHRPLLLPQETISVDMLFGELLV